MKISDLKWQSLLVDSFLPDPETRNFTRSVSGVLYSRVMPTKVKTPQLMGWSVILAAELGISKPTLQDNCDLDLLAGNFVSPGMKPHALRYGGHQFGNWAGQLGDGRAIALGEFESDKAGWQEFQLKGAGPTPYSRRADGRAVLRSSVREFLCSEAMHALGIPTTRALSLMGTGDQVVRDMFYDGNARPEPGAIVCRVAPSFLRFGNFEILAANGETELLQNLLVYLVKNFVPELDLNDPDLPLHYLSWISDRTAVLISKWMSAGFVHGVMNTDNMSALGLTIDYGPYGWLDDYDPGWTPNTTDAGGRRYCYARQFQMAHWNLARLAEALLTLVPGKAFEQRALEILETCATRFQASYNKSFLAKCGVLKDDFAEASPQEQQCLADLSGLLEKSKIDFTLFFRGLSEFRKQESNYENQSDFESWLTEISYAPVDISQLQKWSVWFKNLQIKWDALGPLEHQRNAAAIKMNSVNPVFVLRNYIAQLAIKDAEKSDIKLLNSVLSACETPFEENAFTMPWKQKRPEWAKNEPGCSALSCSS